jgi:hypothetical protein
MHEAYIWSIYIVFVAGVFSKQNMHIGSISDTYASFVSFQD